MADDGFTSAAESRRLEAEADALLKGDAKQRGFIRNNGRGYSAYARSIGIITKKTLETTYKHEVSVTLLFSAAEAEKLSVDEAFDIVTRPGLFDGKSLDNTVPSQRQVRSGKLDRKEA